MGSRHQARAAALQALYALEMNPALKPDEALGRALEGHGDGVDIGFADALVREAWQRRAELDRMLGNASRRWKLRRMDRVDLSLLRLAAYELSCREDTPAAVILNEAVELAKEFGSEESPGFVNGILDRIAQQSRTAELSRSQVP